MKVPSPTTVDEYLDRVNDPLKRSVLERIGQIIREEVPDVDETIKYGIPTYMRLGYIASFAAFKNHCSFFPGHTVRDFGEELKGYKLSKGTVQFSPKSPLPDDLVREMIRARVAENAAEVG
jgi:uncharacterized protein YdhG (YjbR/CyaY superfamily)